MAKNVNRMNQAMDFDDEEQDSSVINFFGFELSKKSLMILGIGVLVIVGIIAGNGVIKKNKDAKELAAYEAELEEYRRTHQTVQDTRSLEERMQAELVKQYGNPPEGFKWNFDGSLIALSDESSCEDVIYQYLRALSMLDFATAQRYSSDSTVIKSYKNYYGVAATSITNYYDNFLRKQYKKSLASLEVLKVGDTVTEADGTKYVSVDIACLDLEDKDFWLKDKDMIYAKMYSYQDNEDDQVKAKQYLYDYIYENYDNGTIGKKTHTIELVCAKDNGKGWLISNDKELHSVLTYDTGLDVAQYILDEYRLYYTDRNLSEQLGDGKTWVQADDYEDKKYDGSEDSTGSLTEPDESWHVSYTVEDSSSSENEEPYAITYEYYPYAPLINYTANGIDLDVHSMPYDVVVKLYELAYEAHYITKDSDGNYKYLYGLDGYLPYPEKEEESSELEID